MLASIWTAVWGWKDVNTGGEGRQALKAHMDLYKAVFLTSSPLGIVPAGDASLAKYESNVTLLN